MKSFEARKRLQHYPYSHGLKTPQERPLSQVKTSLKTKIEELWEKQSGKCYWCQKPLNDSPRPRIYRNKYLLCKSCNQKIHKETREYGEQLLNPHTTKEKEQPQNSEWTPFDTMILDSQMPAKDEGSTLTSGTNPLQPVEEPPLSCLRSPTVRKQELP